MTYYNVEFIDGDKCRVEANNEIEAKIEACEIVQGVKVLSVKAEKPIELSFHSAIYGNKLG
jgi:hypothetical protein